MVAVYCDREVMRFVPGGALDPSAVCDVLERHLADNASGLGFYAVEERDSGAVVGEVGFGIFETGEREVGWTFARAYWGRGYATEAVAAFLASAAGPAVAVIDAENLASIRVAERAGLRRRGEAERAGRPHVVFERRRQVSATAAAATTAEQSTSAAPARAGSAAPASTEAASSSTPAANSAVSTSTSRRG